MKNNTESLRRALFRARDDINAALDMLAGAPPEPTGRGRQPRYPWRTMKVGETFVAKLADFPTAGLSPELRLRNSAANYKWRYGLTFTVIPNPDFETFTITRTL